MPTQSGTVVALSISERRGVPKTNVPAVRLRAGWGIDNDAHAGDWHRQVSLLALESIDKMRAKGATVTPGNFAENITVSGLPIPELPIGQRLAVGSAVLEVTQIGKECHAHCAIYQQVGDCVMPREGIFARVLVSGEAYIGDAVTLLPAIVPEPG